VFTVRRLGVLIAAVMLLATATVSLVSASPRLPASEAEWLAMSSAQQAAVMGYLRQQLEQGLRDRTLEIQEVRDDGSSNMLASVEVALVSVSRNCVVQWTSVAGGDWVRGGGWTDASEQMSHIVAGLKTQSPYSSGQLLRDGVHKGYWGQATTNATHAESYTGWHWTWSWETSTWFTKGWHTARIGSTYYLGPDNYCTASKLL
jgi:hypothetical protein